MKKITFLLLGFLLINCSMVFSENLDEYINRLLAKDYTDDGPGGAILVSKGDKILYQNGFGKASIELNIDNTSAHVFEIGSMTKQFTAVAILMLAEEGKIKLDDSLSTYLPDFSANKKPIQIHHLLNHTSGIVNYTTLPEWADQWREEIAVEKMIALFKNYPLEFDPGEEWEYSNSNYILLGALIEKVSELPYETFIQERIFEPLGMNHSYYGSRSEIIKNRASGYQKRTAEEFQNAEFLSFSQPYAAGSIMSTVGDLNIWMHAINNNKLISEKSKNLAFTNHTLNNGKPTGYGYGWQINTIAGSKSVEHGGGIFGFVSFGIYLPDEDIYVAILTNRDGISPDEIAIKVAAFVAGKPIENPPKISLTDEQLQEYVAVYEFENQTTRTITRKENQLYSQRSGGSRIEIFPFEKDQFYFDDSFTRLTFKRDNMNSISSVVTIHRGSETTAKRTNKKIAVYEEITMTLEELKRFEGKYELDPNFVLRISIHENKIFGQATGQPEFEIFPMSKLEFFLKVVDARIEFIEGENGEIESLILHQGGQALPGQKK